MLQHAYMRLDEKRESRDWGGGSGDIYADPPLPSPPAEDDAAFAGAGAPAAAAGAPATE